MHSPARTAARSTPAARWSRPATPRPVRPVHSLPAAFTPCPAAGPASGRWSRPDGTTPPGWTARVAGSRSSPVASRAGACLARPATATDRHRHAESRRTSNDVGRPAGRKAQVATYQYRFDQHGLVETARLIGTAPRGLTCPTCGHLARRVFSTPLLALADRRAMSLIDRTVKSSDEPDVVTSLPPRRHPRGAPRAPAFPALHRLPRP